MRVLVTGANGFLARNLIFHLAEIPSIEVVTFTRSNRVEELPSLLKDTDFIFHFAGVNRPSLSSEYKVGNTLFTQTLADSLVDVKARTGRNIPIIFTSSIHATYDTPYGISKRAAEDILFNLRHQYDIPVYIFRLPNVFGKWSKPNYNSVVATFCFNTIFSLPIDVHDPTANLSLVYVDDVVECMIDILLSGSCTFDDGFAIVSPQFTTTVGDLLSHIQSFNSSRSDLTIGRVGTGFIRALYATYVSFLPPDNFSYPLPQHSDTRGVFVEMLKTPDAGQFSFFTAKPGITRGGHYHHTKTEKFLVVRGNARFGFRNMLTNEKHFIDSCGDNPQIVETVPGWTHNITNIGDDEMIVFLWANEIFSNSKPDTIRGTI